MEGKNSSPPDELSAPPQYTWEERRVSSASDLFDQLNKVSLNRAHQQAQREISSSELLELLGKPAPESELRKARSSTADSFSQGSSITNRTTHGADGNRDYQSAAIDQCNITSAVDYGSRDYYQTSADTSGTHYVYKEQESDELYKSGTDPMGNWWEGSLYY